MEVDFRKNYLEARELVAKELKEKYNLVESYRDNDRLTLDSSNYSIHLTFFVPDGDNVSVSEKGKESGYGKSFMNIVAQKFPKRDEMISFLKILFSDTKPYDYTSQTIKRKLQKKIIFFEQQFPEYFI